MKKHVVLITGGAGFLGQHLVKYLEEHCADDFAEIRIADRQRFKPFLDFGRPIPINEFAVDCSEYGELSPVVRGCTAVFNLCGRPLPLTVYQDSELQYRDNFKSVEALTRAMLDNNVHVSDGLCGSTKYDLPGLSETASDDFPEKSQFWFGDYGETKYRGEKLARNSDGLTCSDGHTVLRSVAIRPCLIYGEGDTLIVPQLIRLCEDYGSLLQFGARESKMDFAYAGNVVHLLNLSLKNLVRNPKDFGGEMFFCNEDNIDEFYTFYEPILQSMGHRVSSWCVNSVVADCSSFVWEHFFRILGVFKVKYEHQLPTQFLVKAVSGMLFTYESTKLKMVMNYRPIFDPVQSKSNTIKWWKNYKLDRSFV